VERHSGKYFATGTALRQISLATGVTLTLKRSGKHVVLVRLTLEQFVFWPKLPPKRGIWHQKSQKIFPGVTPRTPSAEGGDPLPHLPSAPLHAVRGGASSPVAGTWLSETVPPSQNLPLTPLQPRYMHSGNNRPHLVMPKCRNKFLAITCLTLVLKV